MMGQMNAIDKRRRPDAVPTFEGDELHHIEQLNSDKESCWKTRISVQDSLNRALVSFQANKRRAFYRWFKYKEAFSADLVEYLLEKLGVSSGSLIDPFAGSGTALFSAGALGIHAEGIEVLPIGQIIISTRHLIECDLRANDINRLQAWIDESKWNSCKEEKPINELRITSNAYPAETARAVRRYLAAIENENSRVRAVLFFALLCILESISYTRKDGQYLRWDYRSGRRKGKKVFDKGLILSFEQAITRKLREIVSDLRAAEQPEVLFPATHASPEIILHPGSCLEILPKLNRKSYDCLFTSPPYCNRYDYTRTYALELALMGINEDGLVKIRQEMLSCTVENRAKDLISINPTWKPAIDAADSHELLQTILSYLESQNQNNLLNNRGIPRMVHGYFYEMACVIAEFARVLKRGAPLIMVNDNVRYAGASICVDIILSEIAEKLGFEAEQILVLPNGKGNSSQQMGLHGRKPLRKCVYIWRRI